MENYSKLFLKFVLIIAVLVICSGCAQLQHIGTKPPRDAIVLFDGSDFSHWVGEDGNSVKWELNDGVMKIVPKTHSIVTKQNFKDFKLHVEFKIPATDPNVHWGHRGNSGIYIQRRYEVQILDSYGKKPHFQDCGAIYKTRIPDKNVCKKAGQWQSYDIIFKSPRWDTSGEKAVKIANARITVWQNGVLIHNDVEIPNKTGAGQPEGTEPGPIKLQDHYWGHGNPVEFRNIWIVPLNLDCK